MKTSEKVELFIRGEFSNIDICMEDKKVPLYRAGEGAWAKEYEHFEVVWPLDVNVRLKSWLGKKWEILIKVGGKLIFRRTGKFLEKRWITLSGSFLKEGLSETEVSPGYTILSCI